MTKYTTKFPLLAALGHPHNWTDTFSSRRYGENSKQSMSELEFSVLQMGKHIVYVRQSEILVPP